MKKSFRRVVIGIFCAVFVCSLAACELDLGNPPPDTQTSEPPETVSPTVKVATTVTVNPEPESTEVRITTNPSGAFLELNPQKNSRGLIPKTGKQLGKSPLTFILKPSDFKRTSKCVSFEILARMKGYLGNITFETCLTTGDPGPPIQKAFYQGNMPLAACAYYDPGCDGT